MKDISVQDLADNLAFTCGQEDKKPLMHVCGHEVGGDRPLLIAGPCRVESYDQLEQVAHVLVSSEIKFLRAGVFKPATFPYAPEGKGLAGLEILETIRKEFDLKIVSEIMSISQIDDAVGNIDVIQVGARNMQNFDLLVALAQTGKPILLKRHPGASLRDWLGAAEWIMARGNSQVLLCERGVNMPHTHGSNVRWGLDITSTPAIRNYSHLPVIVDPSHSGGIRQYVPSLSRAAIASGADGLIIEIHPEPDASVSDPDQALELLQFKKLVPSLKKIYNIVQNAY